METTEINKEKVQEKRNELSLLKEEFGKRAEKVLSILTDTKSYKSNENFCSGSEKININGVEMNKSDLCQIDLSELKFAIADLKVIVNRIEKINTEPKL